MQNSIVHILKLLLFGLIPPEKPDENPTAEQCRLYKRAKRRWSYFVAVSLWVGFIALLCLLLPAYGLLPARFDRVAWGEDIQAQVAPITAQVEVVKYQVQELGAKTDELLLSQYRVELRDTRKRQCKAIADRDAERKDIYGRLMEELQRKYRPLNTGEAWPVPGCDEI